MRHYVCPECGSANIRGEAWASINDEMLIDFVEGADFWCPDCEQHSSVACKIDVATGQCVDCGLYGRPHGEAFKPSRDVAATEAQIVEHVITLLKQARDLLVTAGTPKAAARVRLALSSAKRREMFAAEQARRA